MPLACVRMRQVARQRGLEYILGIGRHRSNCSVRRPSRKKMESYLAVPAVGWPQWTWHKRNIYKATKARYQKMLADEQMGRAIIEYKE